MTERLYYIDSHLVKFSAVVQSCEERNGKWAVKLDRTAFFPGGGGQLPDTGYIGGVRVADMEELDDGEIIHITESPLDPGAGVECAIDWDTRFGYMQNHTGEHIISGLAHSLFGVNNIGFHMGAEGVIVDWDGYLDREQLEEIERRANEAIHRDLPITICFPGPEELGGLEYRSKLDITENVRLVSIEDVDCCACCAPHCLRTGEVGQIKLYESVKNKGGVRVRMLAGMDAYEDMRIKFANNSEISNALSAKPNETAAAVHRLMDSAEELKLQIRELKDSLIRRSVSALEQTEGNICVFEPDFDGDMLRHVVNVGMELCGGICAAFSGGDRAWKYCMGSKNVNISKAGKQINADLSGRGGGKPPMIQGSMTASRQEIEEYFKKALFGAE
ncbi:MAG: alanyl-tRNA editing protein [Oscillospiraceae bacterium]|nr:alanyl-tRNA editing protein [Oscillospiraceae bacterium]